MEAARGRLSVLANHLITPSATLSDGSFCAQHTTSLDIQPCAAAPPKPSSNGSSGSSSNGSSYLARFINGDGLALKDKVYKHFQQHPELLPPPELSKDAHRQLTLDQMISLFSAHALELKPLHALQHDPAAYFALAEALGNVDLSLAIKTGVQMSLWGGSIVNLGTARHIEAYAASIETLALPGCFAMTELEHGSNVQALQTRATYVRSRDEWDVHTPHEGAIKWWIGNAALHGLTATVFARLIIPSREDPSREEDHGVHGFVVPLRDPATKQPLPGVEIRDCGYKVGLNGVDNGALRFTHVRVPRGALLDRFAQVEPGGVYRSTLPPMKRFAATLGELVGGRVGLASGSTAVLKLATTIAVRFSLQRAQFGPPGGPEVAVLDYTSQQAKLMPLLASCFAFHFAKDHLISKYAEMKRTKEEELVADVHSLSAGLKAYISGYTAGAINTCREACGGHGYAAVNRFGSLRNDHDIFQTFEGDNTVLLQQVAGELLKHYRRKFAGGTWSATWAYLGQQTALFLAGHNPLAAHATDESHLRDPAFLLAALRYRAARLLHTAALRLRKHTRALGAFSAWNKCLPHLLALANAHVESVILDQFVAGVARCDDPHAKGQLKAACDLFALGRIWADVGTWRNDDYIAPAKAKAIHRLIESLCLELRGQAAELVFAFALPDHILRAPIGLAGHVGHDLYAEYLQASGFEPDAEGH